MDYKVYNCLTLYQLDNTSEYTIYNIIHFSASIHGHGNTDILPTYSPVPARHDRWWGRPLIWVYRAKDEYEVPDMGVKGFGWVWSA